MQVAPVGQQLQAESQRLATGDQMPTAQHSPCNMCIMPPAQLSIPHSAAGPPCLHCSDPCAACRRYSATALVPLPRPLLLPPWLLPAGQGRGGALRGSRSCAAAPAGRASQAWRRPAEGAERGRHVWTAARTFQLVRGVHSSSGGGGGSSLSVRLVSSAPNQPLPAHLQHAALAQHVSEGLHHSQSGQSSTRGVRHTSAAQVGHAGLHGQVGRWNKGGR